MWDTPYCFSLLKAEFLGLPKLVFGKCLRFGLNLISRPAQEELPMAAATTHTGLSYAAITLMAVSKVSDSCNHSLRAWDGGRWYRRDNRGINLYFNF
jgi:hypothetical protein